MLTSEFLNDVKLSPMATLLAIIVTAIGMISLFLVLLLYLTDSSIEKFHHDYPQIYRLETQFNLPNGEEVKSAQAPLPLVSALQNEKNIKDIAYAFRLFTDLQVNGKIHSDVAIYAVSPNFLTTLNPYQQKIPYLSQNEIIITPEFNRQYIHLNNPKGQVITLGNKGSFVIKDVVNLNTASRFNTHAVIAFSPEIINGYHDKRHDWYDMHTYLFATMADGTEPDNEWLKTLVTRNAPQLPGAPFSPEEFIQLSARNITDIHYDAELPDEISTVTSQSYLYTLYIAGFFIFLTTAMNFYNINNIINTNKKSSFQIKKSIGASNYQLLAESFSIATLQTVCVLILAFLFLIIFMQASESVKTLVLVQEKTRLAISFSVAFFLLYTAILISHYFYLSTTVFPNKSLHNDVYNTHSISHYVYQLTLSIQIAIAGIIIYLWAGVMTQIDFMDSHTFGYEKEKIVTFPLSDELKSLASINSLQDELKNSLETSPIALSSWQPFDMSRTSTSVFHQDQQEQDKLASVNVLNVNKNFTEIWGIKTVAGYKNPITPSENDKIHHAIATKTFVSTMGKSSNDDVLNTLFYINDNRQAVRILRVINDFYLADRDKNTTPLLIFINDDVQRYGALKLQRNSDFGAAKMILERYGVNTDQIKFVENIHQEYFNNNNLMKKTISLVTLFSVVLLLLSTIIISIAESKRISKILKIMESVGGSMYTHIIFFIQQNITPVLVAMIIAFPIGFVLLQKWLSKYNFINGLSYFYAFGTLLLFMVSIVGVMAMSLILSHNKKNK